MIEVSTLSVRTSDRGGPVADHVQGSVPNGKRQFVLLIHGYANPRKSAEQSYELFIQNLDDTVSQAHSSINVPMVEFFWPGDNRFLPWLTYWSEVPVAIDSGERLWEFLASRIGPGGSPTEVYFVAHSLGCRVVLETLKRFVSMPAPAGSVIFRSICLMAAAVPVSAVQDAAALLFACHLPQRSQVLFSTSDVTLAAFFRPGEGLAGEGMSEAVGRRGLPTENWNARWNCLGYGHHDYWKSPLPTLQLASLLGVAVNQPILDNAIVKREGPEKRQMLEAPPPEKRKLFSRRIL